MSIIVAKKVGKVDIREHGSGNAGMSNVIRVIGLKAGIFVGVVDVMKGWLATAWVPTLIIGNCDGTDITIIKIAAGGAAVLGHSYTIFARFRGGKGIATLAGMMTALYPAAVFISFLMFSVTFGIWGYVSLSSITAAVTLPISVLLLPLAGLTPAPQSFVIFTLVVPLFVIFKHRDNIARLRRGNEKRFERVLVFRRR
tara:strand:- start:11455 stop:12048 length:594 start_codon:yes stop_codon:yes gene_type:complete